MTFFLVYGELGLMQIPLLYFYMVYIDILGGLIFSEPMIACERVEARESLG